jgi:ribosomal protein L37AE/L43A
VRFSANDISSKVTEQEDRVAKWVLGCANCNADFTHSEILPDDRLPDAFLRAVPKPEFPAGGLQFTCPHCAETSVYRRHQLIYQAK